MILMKSLPIPLIGKLLNLTSIETKDKIILKLTLRMTVTNQLEATAKPLKARE